MQRKKAEGKFDSRDWQSYEVTVRDGRIAVKLNGRQILEYTDPQPLRRGHIGLQFKPAGRVPQDPAQAAGAEPACSMART